VAGSYLPHGIVEVIRATRQLAEPAMANVESILFKYRGQPVP
jgi:hypothetical protein